MPPSNCFETGRRSPTQSSVRPFGPRQQMDVWFSIEEEPSPRGAKASWRNLKTFVSAPPKRVRRAFALLTRTYHGCRLFGRSKKGHRAAFLAQSASSVATEEAHSRCKVRRRLGNLPRSNVPVLLWARH